jgi:hypothetical protein
MPRLTVLLISLVLGAGCAVLISCGGDDGPENGIPPTDADGMLGELERAQAAFAEGNCTEVEESAEQLQAAAQNLETKGVDAEVSDGIEQGAARLAELANDPSQCEETTTTEDTTTKETEPTTTTEETTPTTTETTTTEETTTTQTEEEPAPPEDGGPDGGPTQPPGQTENGETGTGGTGDGDRAAKHGKDKKPKKPKHKAKKD